MEMKTFEEEKTVLIRRESGIDRVVYLFNFYHRPVEIRAFSEQGHWEKVLDSSSREWGGMGGKSPETIPSSGSEVFLAMNEYNFVLYRRLKG